MEVKGKILNQAGQVITASVAFTQLEPFKILEAPVVTNGYYNAWATSEIASNSGVTFSAPGYTTVTIPLYTLLSKPDVVLKSNQPAKAGISPTMILLVLGAVYTYRRMKEREGKKIGQLKSSDVFVIFLILGGIMAFSVIRKILESLGLMDSADTQNLDNEAENPNSFWNPQMWAAIPPGSNYSYSFSLTRATELATELYNAFGWFNDNEEQAINVFKQCKTQANASYICYAFQQKYSQDCLTFLRGGIWPQDRLSDKDVAKINDYVKKLPRY